MNDASFSRRDSVGSLVDWSMITSKNPVFHIRLCGCRLVGLREKPRKFRVVRIACFSVRHLTRVISLTNNSSVTRSFLLVIRQPDVSEITHRCPSFSGSAWPMHIPLGMIWFRNCRLVTQTSLFRYDMWIPWTV
ncbi:hypothetical protein TNCV_4417131 [Trichonephila clavipes]|uniref:Uncharacterized protein n=1 Tax=Trichonephila clavipes TaxID=2585209 RepID=A0A8X6S4V4_TRICX|nr:hypothetical protein TNCV_4417131 [Trichonephila clavipes]